MISSAFETALGWRSLGPQELEREYSPSSCVGGNIAPFLNEYKEQSEASRQWCTETGLDLQTLRYGSLLSQSIDMATPRIENAPLVIFIHGGYWQRLSKFESFGPAADLLSAGVSFAAVDYTLAPAATVDQIVAECRTAVALVHDEAAKLGVDPNRIFLAGSSAGAHLVAMVALDLEIKWRPAGLVLLSGVYELEPLISTSINDAVGLDVEASHRNSPARLPIMNPPRSVIAWGDNETSQFKRQSELFAELVGSHGEVPFVLEAPDRNHFNIVGDLGRRETPLGSAVAELIESTRENNAQL